MTGTYTLDAAATGAPGLGYLRVTASPALPEGSYKLYVQPNTTGYANQWYGGADIGSATVIVLNPATLPVPVALTPLP